MRRRLFAAAVGLLCISAGLGAAGEKRPEEERKEAEATESRLATVEQRLSRLEEMLAALLERFADRASQEALGRLKQEVDSLGAEPPDSAVAAGAGGPSRQDQAPVQAEVIRSGTDVSQEVVGMPYSGYMELHVNNDGLNPTTLDFHRFVLLFGHGFGERIRFWSEVELEHAFVEGGERSGEIELEQAYLDFLIDPKLNFRAGMLLTPVGIINERHEPPSFNGVERPFVDTVILPTTWFGSGAGFVGDLGKGLSYKTYVMSSLNAFGFSADEGLRGGRQKGFIENGRNLAWTGRLEYRGMPGLNLGTSFWTGETGFDFRDLNGRVKIFEFDGRYRWDRLQARGQFVVSDLGDAASINNALRQRFGSNPNIAEQMRGFYLEGGADILPGSWSHDLVVFYRYENFDTQFDMPAGFLPLKHLDRSAHVLGLTYFPYPDIALKFDYNIMRNESLIIRAPNRWNFGLGWWF